jgi:hypothetical protein
MPPAGQRPVTPRQREALEALRRLRARGLTPATPLEVAREIGFRDYSRPDERAVLKTSTVSASSRTQAPLTALVAHGLVVKTNRRGGGRGYGYDVAPNPEDFARWVVSIEHDEQLARQVTLREIVERAKEALGE